LQREITEEIQSHLELEARKYMRSGLPEAEAYRRANIALGGKAQFIEECREQRGIPLVENVLRDCRYAFRAFRRSPAFALAVILMVALGVGASTMVFAFCKAMLLATLPVPNPQQLYLASIEVPGFPPDPYFSFPDLERIEKTASGSAALTGFTDSVDYHLQDNSGASSTFKGQLVAGNFSPFCSFRPLPAVFLANGTTIPGKSLSPSSVIDSGRSTLAPITA
jgi:hypothetical protein